MRILANKISTDTAKKEWTISVPKEMIIDEFFAFFKKENETEEITYPALNYKLLFREEENHYLITVPHELIAQNSISGATTSWHFGGKTKEQFVSIHTDGPLQFKTLPLPKDLYNYRFEFPEAVLTLVAEPKKFSVSLTDLAMDEEMAKFKFKVEADFELSELDAELIFARRANPHLYLYFEQEQAFPVTVSSKDGKIEYTLRLADLDTDFLVDNSNNMDALLCFKNDWHVSKREFVQASQAQKKQIDKKVFLKEKPFTSLDAYVTGSNRLSFYFRKELQKEAQLAEFKETPESFQFRFFFKNHLEAPRLVFKRRNKKFRTSEYTLKTEFAIKKKFQSYSLDLSKEHLYPLQTYQPNEDWDAFIRSEGMPDFPLFVPNQVALKSDYHSIDGGKYLVLPQKTALSNFSFQFRKAPSKPGAAKKLVIFGSVSEAPFRTEPYFNPDARSFFEVDFVQKDTSFISLMTEKYPARTTLFSSADFTGIDPTDRENAERDAEKNFFLKLRLAEPDYILLDAFTDVTRPVLWFNQHAALTYSKTIEASHLADKIMFDRLLTHENAETFFEEWRKYAKEFLEQLKEFVPEERIILNKGGTTLNYVDANGKVVPYNNKMGIEMKQYFWDRLNNFILSVIPNARVIDFDAKNYTGSSKNPLGHSYATFEEAYYKDFLKEMVYLAETPKH